MEQQYAVFEDIELQRQPAATGARFANYLIDMIAYYAVFLATMLLLGVLAAVAGASEGLSEFLDSIPGKLFLYLIAFGLLVTFFTVIEGASKGRSLGKLITGTVAIRDDGATITWKDAFMRSLCRIIPFEMFSGLSGYPWHDKLSKTIVVKK